MTAGVPTMITQDGETRSVSGWARRLRTTRDKIRTRHAKGLRLDTETIGGVHRPLKPATRKGAKPRTVGDVARAAHATADRVVLIRVIRAMGYDCEARELDGEEVLVVRGEAGR